MNIQLSRSVLRIVLSAGFVSVPGCDICPSFPSPVNWEKSFGSSEDMAGTDLLPTSDGGFIIAGSTGPPSTYISNATERDFYLLKTDGAGTKLWSNRYGASDYDYAQHVLPTAAGGFLLVGSSIPGESFTSTIAATHISATRTDSTGAQQWFRTYARTTRETPHAALETSEGDFIVAGSTSPDSETESDFYLLRIDASGNEVWNRTYGDARRNVFLSVKAGEENGLVVAGFSAEIGFPDTSFWFNEFRLDNDGMEISHQEASEPLAMYVQKVLPLGNGEYIAAGTKDDSRIGVARIRSDAQIMWEREFPVEFETGPTGGTSDLLIQVSFIVPLAGDGFMLGGQAVTCCVPTCLDGFVIRIDDEGQPEFIRQYGHTAQDRIEGLHVLPDGTYVVAGSTGSENPYREEIYMFRAGP